MTRVSTANRNKRSKAIQLLTKLLESGRCDVRLVATELVVDEDMIARFVAGEIEMPMERQLCLAKFLIDNVPTLSRQGHNLLSQVRAGLRFRGTDTALHSTAPVPTGKLH